VTERVRLAERTVPVSSHADVIVVGGGAAGIAAAAAAARLGASTLLIERYGSLGGMATGGLIALLLTLDDGRGRQVIAGICQEMVDRMQARGATFAPPATEWASPDEDLVERYRRWGLVWGRGPHSVRYNVAYDPEEFRLVANQLLIEAGVRIRLHTWAFEPILSDGRITHIATLSKAGLEAFECQAVVDASGDGDIFAAAGESFESTSCVPWLWYRMGGVVDRHEAVERASGQFFPSLGGRFFEAPGRGRTLMPWGASDSVDRRIDATNPEDLTWAELECRRLVMEQADKLRREVPGFEGAYVSDVAWQLGVYESRRLLGKHQLVRSEEGVVFEDTVASTGNWTRYGQLYSVPLRSLQPQRVSNLLVAGRCISVDTVVHHSTKEIPACMATGQAAGVAAALMVKRPEAADAATIQRLLVESGAWLPEPAGSGS
jgi:FAD dependent oxidoreductase